MNLLIIYCKISFDVFQYDFFSGHANPLVKTITKAATVKDFPLNLSNPKFISPILIE